MVYICNPWKKGHYSIRKQMDVWHSSNVLLILLEIERVIIILLNNTLDNSFIDAKPSKKKGN
uniref:Uncharacterized protein n=1 Tax=Rhizophora mucronata TaxID=61149 RepID=A0A2P2MWU0_RHIMU